MRRVDTKPLRFDTHVPHGDAAQDEEKHGRSARTGTRSVSPRDTSSGYRDTVRDRAYSPPIPLPAHAPGHNADLAPGPP